MLKNPISMKGRIDRCWLFAFSMSEAQAKSLLPSQLEPVTHEGKAFWNIVVSHIDSMRPASLPIKWGISYWHAAYRICVKFRTAGGEQIEGLYFLRSDCDNALMSKAGNLLTDFNFHVAGISSTDSLTETKVQIESKDMPGYAVMSKAEPAFLQAGSSFETLQEAGEFLKYKANGISIDGDGLANIVHIIRDESKWQYQLVNVVKQDWSYFNDKEANFEVCYQLQPIDYVWQKAKIYK
jgi:hypothetical protein